MKYRKGETGIDIPGRNPRVFQKSDGYWYFLTRERTEVGPFPSDEAASMGVNDYAGFSQDADRVYLDDLDEPVGDGLAELLPGSLSPEGAASSCLPGERIFDNGETEAQRQARQFSSRVFSRDDVWYFFTREGRDSGPFATRAEAEEAVARYVGFAGDLDRVIDEALKEEAAEDTSPDDPL